MTSFSKQLDADTRLFFAARQGDLETVKALASNRNVNADCGVLGAASLGDLKQDPNRKACAEFCVAQGGSPFWLLRTEDISPKPKFLSFGPQKLSFGGHNISVKACDTGRNNLNALQSAN